MLTRRGCEFLRAEISPALEKRIHQELQVVPFSPVSLGVTNGAFDVFIKTPTHYIVPQFWATGLGISLEDHRTPGFQAPLLKFQGSLREEQKVLVNNVLAAYSTASGGCLLCAQTGQGKTTMALYVACKLQKKTVVLVHKAFLADQWAERCRQFVPDAKVTLYGNGTHDFSGDIVVATIQTILSRGLPSDHLITPGFVIIDEAHRVAAPSFSKVIVGLNAPYILGLSATPERQDKLSKVIHWICGPLIKSDGEDTTQHQVTVLRKTFSGSTTREIPQNRRGDVDHASLITQLAEDDARTAFIVKCMVEHVSTETDCLVLSHRRSQCLLLAECLRHQGYDATTYLGGDKVVPSNKVLVCTYSLVSEGFDEPRLSTLVFATPASNITQAVGRILRTPGPKLILDILDTNAVSRSQAAKRRIFYASAGYLGTVSKAPKVYLFRDDD